MLSMYRRFRSWARDAWPWFTICASAFLAAFGSWRYRISVHERSKDTFREQLRQDQERRSQEALVSQAKREAREARAREHEARSSALAAEVKAAEGDRSVPSELRELSDKEAVERLKRNVGLILVLTLLPMPARADDVCVPRAVVDSANATIERYRKVVVPVLVERVDELDAALVETKGALDESKLAESEALRQGRADRAAAAADREELRRVEKRRWIWVGVSAAIGAIFGGYTVKVLL